MSDIKRLRDVAKKASENAYSPYSKAKVGSALLTSDGTMYSGCNVENSSYGATMCAERTAIFKAASDGHREIKAIYIYSKDGWPPCGLCRQVLAEFATEDLIVIIGDEAGKETHVSFDNLFPLAFTPKHLS